MKNTILILFLLIFVSNGYCQINLCGNVESQLQPKSPNVSEMLKYVDRPVSLFNGTVNISIPLCEIDAEDITLPLSLNYNSTGFRPSQEASWVGLGWSLSLNSCISRYIKFADDFLEYNRLKKGLLFLKQGYYGSYKYQTLGELTEGVYLYGNPSVLYSEFTVDKEPDIFSLSIWNAADKFVITDNPESKEQAVFIDKPQGNKLKILKDNNNKYYFEVVRNDGSVYEFKKRELTYTYSGSGRKTENLLFRSDNAMEHDIYASSWFLTKIVTPKHKVITFEYEDETYDGITHESCVKYNFESLLPYEAIHFEYNPRLAEANGQRIYDHPLYGWSKVRIKTARLKEIVWDHGRIEFLTSKREDVYDYDREPKVTGNDSDPHKLDGINIYNSLNHLVKSYKFNYDYFGKGDYLAKRLKLQSVEDKLDGKNKYVFEYNEDIEFPSKATLSTDYWGYYNAKVYGEKWWCKYKGLDGATKDSKYAESMLGMLTSIIHPTGGKEVFTYEPNQYLWTDFVKEGGELLDSLCFDVNKYYGSKTVSLKCDKKQNVIMEGLIGGGNINAYGNPGPVLTITKESSDWCYHLLPSTIHPEGNTIPLHGSVTLQPGSYKISVPVPMPYSSGENWYHTHIVLKTYNATPVTYKEVVEEKRGAGLRIKSIDGGGKHRDFEYSQGTLIIEPVITQKKDLFTILPYGNTNVNYIYANRLIAQLSESVIPLSTLSKGYHIGYRTVKEKINNQVTTYNYRVKKELSLRNTPALGTIPVFDNGLLDSKTITEDGKTIYKEDYSYNQTASRIISDVKLSRQYGIVPVPDNRFICYCPSVQHTEKDFIVTKNEFSYNNELQVSSIRKTVCGDNNEEVTSFLYTSDSNDEMHRKMFDSNIVIPIRKVTINNGVIANGEKIDFLYDSSNNVFLPKRISYLEQSNSAPDNSSSYYPKVVYDKYDHRGNPVQVTENGIRTVYIWGYGGQYPIAKISNMTYNNLIGMISEYQLQQMCDAPQPTAEQWSLIENLRKKASGALVTSYKYEPLIGITSLTAPNGFTTCYSYDSAGRLIETYLLNDRCKHTISKYSYNLVGSKQ